MSFASLLLMALALAMDATAVAATRGLLARRVGLRELALVAGLFGGFQGIMPLIGSVIGAQLGPLVQRFDHWIAFVLLGAIGAKMLWDARHDERDEQATRYPFDPKLLLILAVATSIDALAVGITLPMLGVPLLSAALTIGITTALSSAIGLLAGRRFGARLGAPLERAGGLVLIGLGLKILIEHLRG